MNEKEVEIFFYLIKKVSEGKTYLPALAKELKERSNSNDNLYITEKDLDSLLIFRLEGMKGAEALKYLIQSFKAASDEGRKVTFYK